MSQEQSILAFDAMSGDKGPAEAIAALKLALDNFENLGTIQLVGDTQVLSPLLEREGLNKHPSITLVHAPDVISMEDKPRASLRKKDSSMMVALDLVKNGKADAAISCGNTASLMAGATIKLRTLSGIERPALATIWPRPSKEGNFILIDGGANPTPRAVHMVHNAVLGSNYAREVLGVKNPTVGLLTIGTEEGKGTELIQLSHELLKKCDQNINYIGLIEGFQVFEGRCDVIVCDGFTGNILLKVCESLFKSLKGFLKEEITKTPIRKLGAFLSQGAFHEMREHLDPEQYAGAPLLGIRGLVLKAHGSSNRGHLMNALRIASLVVRQDMNAHILKDIEQINPLIDFVEENGD